MPNCQLVLKTNSSSWLTIRVTVKITVRTGAPNLGRRLVRVSSGYYVCGKHNLGLLGRPRYSTDTKGARRKEQNERLSHRANCNASVHSRISSVTDCCLTWCWPAVPTSDRLSTSFNHFHNRHVSTPTRSSKRQIPAFLPCMSCPRLLAGAHSSRPVVGYFVVDPRATRLSPEQCHFRSSDILPTWNQYNIAGTKIL